MKRETAILIQNFEDFKVVSLLRDYKLAIDNLVGIVEEEILSNAA